MIHLGGHLRKNTNFEAMYFMMKMNLFQKTDKSLQKKNLFIPYDINKLFINLTLELILRLEGVQFDG